MANHNLRNYLGLVWSDREIYSFCLFALPYFHMQRNGHPKTLVNLNLHCLCSLASILFSQVLETAVEKSKRFQVFVVHPY